MKRPLSLWLLFPRVIILLLAAFLLIPGAWAQPTGCYVRLEDASGYTPTSAQINELEAAAAGLCSVFDSAGFQGQFKVYDFGFYLHQEVTEGGYPEPFAKKILEVQELSPYYLLFGKQTDRSGIYTRIWVEMVLPDTGKFGCIDLLSPTLRDDIRKKVEFVTTNTHKTNGNDYLRFYLAEITGITMMKGIAAKYVDCCELHSKGVSACDAFVLPAYLTEVTYSGDDYIEMKQDGSTDFGQPFPKPHYLNTRGDNEQSPLAHVSGFHVLALAKFQGNAFYDAIKVRGKGKVPTIGT